MQEDVRPNPQRAPRTPKPAQRFELVAVQLLNHRKVPRENRDERRGPRQKVGFRRFTLKFSVAAARPGKWTFWSYIWNTPALRKRTIILLDAKELRREGVGISTALSWERTAQDTVAALRRHPKLSKFMRFAHVIVRFGVTGALHAYTNSEGAEYFTLHFDPDRDDAGWVDIQQDGVVLGYGSVFAASLVQSLTDICYRHDRNPILIEQELCSDAAVGHAISRCQRFCQHGYGSSFDEFDRRLQTRHRDRAYMFPVDLFSDEPSQITQNWSHAIVPRFHSRAWSILNQSAQFRVGELAQEIVRFGAEASLNQPRWNRERFVRHVADALVSRLQAQLQRHGVLDLAGLSFLSLKQFAGLGASERLPTQLPSARGKQLGCNIVDGALEDLERPSPVFGHRPRDVRIAACRDIFRSTGTATTLRDELVQHVVKYLKKYYRLLNDKASDSLHGKTRQFQAALGDFRIDVIQSALRSLDTHVDMDDRLPSWAAPTARFGRSPTKDSLDERLLVVDRQEIEGFRTIRNLIRSHLADIEGKRNKRPLSIAVFGPPGSGKSFAVKRIVESIRSNHETVFLQYNLAQFTEAGELNRAFEAITEKIALRKVPIAFFDEFDSRYREQAVGWLKFFLAPMEDGEYNGKPVKDAILVFAGGTAPTFTEFSLETRATIDPLWQDFSKAKGPDFVSRLRGHLNVMGINPADLDDELYLVRRAILLRWLLSEAQNLRPNEEARIETEVLRALLNVPTYKHGGRSMRIVLSLCTGKGGDIGKSTLPTLDQLNMHVNGKAFMDLVLGAYSTLDLRS